MLRRAISLQLSQLLILPTLQGGCRLFRWERHVKIPLTSRSPRLANEANLLPAKSLRYRSDSRLSEIIKIDGQSFRQPSAVGPHKFGELRPGSPGFLKSDAQYTVLPSGTLSRDTVAESCPLATEG